MIKDLQKKLAKKKYLIILLILGIAIMIFPDGKDKNESENIALSESVKGVDVEKLEKVLNKMNGVKSCDVFVTYENQGENNYAYDISGGSDRELEIKLDDNKPLIKSVNNPKVRGIFVLIKGNGVDENETAHIIKGATGVPLHRICVKIVKGE